MNLRLELDLNVQVQLQSQSELLALAVSIVFTTFAAGQPSKSLACCVADLVDSVAGSVLNHVSRAAESFSAGNALADAVERAAFAALLLLLALAVAAPSRGRDIRPCNGFRVGVGPSSSTAARLATSRLRLLRLGFGFGVVGFAAVCLFASCVLLFSLSFSITIGGGSGFRSGLLLLLLFVAQLLRCLPLGFLTRALCLSRSSY